MGNQYLFNRGRTSNIDLFFFVGGLASLAIQLENRLPIILFIFANGGFPFLGLD